ncbi:thymidylate kinase [Schizopora paradoxa]|uniref:Thymidylate kinase n=1 Tax=Schizopora paradoxa TaxID=27342 RepID=A0A0H2RD61_9AGAM|nr:thymidylate kinase [Schizopora paradoxa]
MPSEGRRGAFIVIEGLDRSGKSTQAAALVSRLEETGVSAKLMKFPDRTTPIGRMIDAYLRSESDIDDHAIHLLFSANRWELASNIERTLASGTSIVCDRYAFSGVAFSASKGLPFEWCRSPDVSLPAPDLTLFLDISPEKAKERGGYGEERYEKEEMQRRVREIFAAIATEANEKESWKWTTVDAGMDLESVSKSIWREVESLLSADHGPIQRLWTSASTS